MEKQLNINTTETESGIDSINQAPKKRRENPTASKEEQMERQATLRTQGRKGCKQKHISIILTPDNLEFVSVMGSLTGRNRTQFINYVLDEYKKDRSDTYNQAQELIKNLETRAIDKN